MARPRSENKRNAILAAAAQVIAEHGLAAPTARIARVAGVAEGTLFTYFANKDELLNQLYRELKAELGETMLRGYPKAGTIKTRTRHVWDQFVDWGVANAHKRKAMVQLAVARPAG